MRFVILGWKYAVIAFVLVSCGSSRKALEPAAMTQVYGKYLGILPCADCSGRQITVYLNTDSTYRMFTVYSGKSDDIFEENGVFYLQKDAPFLHLKNAENSTIHTFLYRSGELHLTDRWGNDLSGTKNEFALKKQDFSLQIEGKFWKLLEVNGQKIVNRSEQKKEVYMQLRQENRMMNGYTGCNDFGGNYLLRSANSIEFMNVQQTLLACKDMTNENLLMKILVGTCNYSIENDVLILESANHHQAKFEAVYF